MTYVVTEPCTGCKYTDCVAVCPVDAFREGEQMLAIDPDVCIDCELCVPECPVEAIYLDVNVPEEWVDYIVLNEQRAAEWPEIVTQQSALSDCAAS